MTIETAIVPVAPLQLRLKEFCIWIETRFERRLSRFAFSLRMALAAAVFYALFVVQQTWLANASALVRAVPWLLGAWAAFCVILEIVRRFHDLGRTGGLFWAVVVPYWVSWRVADLFHVADKPERWWIWIVLAVFCLWSFWLTLQLFLRRGTDGPNGYEGRAPRPTPGSP